MKAKEVTLRAVEKEYRASVDGLQDSAMRFALATAAFCESLRQCERRDVVAIYAEAFGEAHQRIAPAVARYNASVRRCDQERGKPTDTAG